MKKFSFYGLMAAALLMTASCQEDITPDNLPGEGSIVTFNVGTPDIATRAYSDGMTANKLQYAVYDKDGNLLLTAEKAIQGSTNVQLELANQSEYSLVFWAAAEDAPYTVDFEAKTMTVDYTAAKAINNDEKRDAFYNKVDVVVNGPSTQTVELTRPFAQLNIGAKDLEQSKTMGYEVKQTEVKVKNVYTTLNLFDGKVDGAITPTFDMANLPQGETFPVAGYDYVAMNYLLVSADKEVVDVTLNYTNGAEERTFTVSSVPVQRNYRTNIYGSLFTNEMDVEVEINPGYDLPDNAAEALQLAAATGGNIKLEEDVVLTSTLNVSANLVIDLNGHTIKAEQPKGPKDTPQENQPILANAAGVTLKLVGGTLQNTAVNGGAVISNEGTLILDGATVLGAPIADGAYPSYAIYNRGKLVVEEGTTITSDRGAINMQNGADVTINGGEFRVTDAIGTRTMTVHVIYAYGSNSKLTINNGNFALDYNAPINAGASVICPAGATINVYGGNFNYAGVKGNQNGIFQNYMGYGAPVNVYGGTYNDETVKKNVATGYKVIEKDGKYIVVEEGVDAVVSTGSELSNAIANGQGDVVLTDDVQFNTAISNDAVINLNNHTFEATGTIKLGNNADLTMVGGNYEVNGTYGHVDVRPSTVEGSTVIYEDVDFSFNQLSKTNGSSTNRLGSVVEVCAVAVDAKTVIKFKNCTFDNAQIVFEGLSGTTGEFDAVFENCTFNALTSSAPIYVQNYVKGTLTLTGCVFNLECTSSTASAVSVSPSTSTSVVVNATDNTLNAVAATPYTYDPSKGETEVHTVKVNGTPKDIKFISAYANTTVNETGTVKTGIAK